MSGELRKPVFILAFLIIVVVLLVELSFISPTLVAALLPDFLTGGAEIPISDQFGALSPDQQARLEALRIEKAGELDSMQQDIEGFGIPYLALIDAILIFTLALMALGTLINKALHAKIQGCLTAVFALLLILIALPALFIALSKLILMVSMFLAFPFGTLAYLIIYGSFPSAAGNAMLSLLFILKVVFSVVLLLAHQRFVENKGLVLYLIVSFVAGIVISLLYGIVPGILVSITDAIAGIVVAVIAIILAVILILGAIVSIVLALKPL
jgi:hypothetical protein